MPKITSKQICVWLCHGKRCYLQPASVQWLHSKRDQAGYGFTSCATKGRKSTNCVFVVEDNQRKIPNFGKHLFLFVYVVLLHCC